MTQTPKEKAIELYDKMMDYCDDKVFYEGRVDKSENAKECALIAVQEIINLLNTTNGLNTSKSPFDIVWAYWVDVKTEIQAL